MQQFEPVMDRVRPSLTTNSDVDCANLWEAFVAPGDVFRRPHEVLDHTGLTTPQKRAILASWASDTSAVHSCPTLRRLPGRQGQPVPVAEVRAALDALHGATPLVHSREPRRRRPNLLGRRLRRPRGLWPASVLN